MKHRLLFFFILIASNAWAQVINTATMDTTDFRYQGKVTIEGYIDAYYAFDFNRPSSANRLYAVSMNRHNEMNINLAFIDLKYSSSRLRARLVPGFGTYINANYSGEDGSLKNLVEASAGVKLSKTKNVWIDAGVFGSPYTNESAISKDHLAYTRSFAPEFVPYYLTGIKLSLPLTSKMNLYVYALNGWQQIGDSNDGKSLGTQLEIRPNNYLLLNWNTYVGKDRMVADSLQSTRLFSDVFFLFTKNKWSVTGCFYAGMQKRNNTNAIWGQGNLIARYSVSEKVSVTGRVEYFEDADGVQVLPVTTANGFSCYSGSLGMNFKLAENILIRTEGRFFQSDKKIFERNEKAVTNSQLLTTNITIWF